MSLPKCIVFLLAALVPTCANAQEDLSLELDLVFLTNSPGTWNERRLTEAIIDLGDVDTNKSQYSFGKDVLVKQISKKNFDFIAGVVGAEIDDTLTLVSDGTVSLDKKRSRVWKVILPDVERQVRGIKVFVDGDSNVASDEYELGPIGASGRPFFKQNKQLALLTLPDSAKTPEAYRLTFADGTESKKRDWPQLPKQFFVKLSSFVGGTSGRDALFESLRRGDIGEATAVAPSSKRVVLMSHAITRFAPPSIGVAFYKNNFAVDYPAIEGRDWNEKKQQGPARVWTLLPLSTSEKDEMVRQLKKLETPRMFAEFIRDNEFSVVEYSERDTDPGGPEPIPDDKLPAGWRQPDVLLGQDVTPKWYEVPRSMDNDLLTSYRRSFQLNEIDRWPDDRLNESWQIYVYEHQFPRNGELQFRAIDLGGRRGFFTVKQLRNWPSQVRKMKQQAAESDGE